MRPLWRDSRWSDVKKYLEACNFYWINNAPPKFLLKLPDAYKVGTEIPALVWLHGMGASPNNFVASQVTHDLVNSMNIAVIGISGTNARGPGSFVSSEDLQKDAAHVAAGLKSLADQITIAKGQIALIGFSQGAMMSMEICARDPQTYAGAICISPGGNNNLRLRSAPPNPKLAECGFVCLVNQKEHFGNVAMASQAAGWARTVTKAVIHRPHPTGQGHSFPPDYGEKTEEWVTFVLSQRRSSVVK